MESIIHLHAYLHYFASWSSLQSLWQYSYLSYFSVSSLYSLIHLSVFYISNVKLIVVFMLKTAHNYYFFIPLGCSAKETGRDCKV